MIKFFRSIRQNLINQGKTSKYLKYAIGEIILVVVGILIALQINNWNALRKLQSEELNLLADIKSNLLVTLNDFQNDTFINNRDINQYLKIEIYVENDLPYDTKLDSAFASLTFWNSPYITSTAYNSLQTKGIDIIQNKVLRYEIVNMYEVKLKILMIDYDQSEWNLSENVVTPFFSKHIRRFHKESLSLARPNDFESLKTNAEFLNILSMIIRQRKRGLVFYSEAMNDVHKLINNIDKELITRQ